MSDQQPAWARDSIVLRLDRAGSLDAPTPEWAFGGSTGAGVRVAVVDSGVEADHPALEGCVDVDAGVEVTIDAEGEVVLTTGPHDDVFGHGTACAGIIHALAPEARVTSVRVLGAGLTGKAAAFHAGLVWAVEQGFDVINLSLGTSRTEWALPFHEVCDRAYFGGSFVVTAANNVARATYPSLFASVASVACNTSADPLRFHANPEPPTEFLARGIAVEVPWMGGGTTTSTGNSYAAPHIAGLAALVKAKHPELRPFQIKAALWATSANVQAALAAGAAVEAPESAGRRGTIVVPGRATAMVVSRQTGPRDAAPPPPPASGAPDPTSAPASEGGAVGGPAPVADAPPGLVVDGAGRPGPWGTVLLAHRRDDGREVTVHDLRRAVGAEPATAAEVVAAARAAAALSHPHLEAVLDVVEHPFPAVVTERAAADLVDLRGAGAWDPGDAVAVVLAVCSGLAALHGAGLVHGDVRRDGVVVGADGTARCGWSGIASVLGSPAGTARATIEAQGLVHLAPEQLRGNRPDARSDVHGAGLLLCELLTGTLPYGAVDNVGALLRQRLGSPPRPAAELDPALPPPLAEVVDAAVAPDPDDRPADGAALGALLTEAAATTIGLDVVARSPFCRSPSTSAVDAD